MESVSPLLELGLVFRLALIGCDECVPVLNLGIKRPRMFPFALLNSTQLSFEQTNTNFLDYVSPLGAETSCPTKDIVDKPAIR